MNKKLKKITTYLVIALAFFLKASYVFALEIEYPTLWGTITDKSSFGDYTCYLFNFGSSVGISIAGLAIAFGGIYYLISYGAGKFTSEAKEWIKAGLLGLLIITCSWLMLDTINPSLENCRWGIVKMIGLYSQNKLTPLPPGTKVAVYQEIPIGTLTENLLTKTIDCYGFDEEGNPVDGNTYVIGKTKTSPQPTYLTHDRADCILQLTDGAQKKAQVVAGLSDEITIQMNKCDCEKYGNCTPACGGKCNDPTACPGGSCTGACVDGACLEPNKPPDCCPTDSGVADPKNKGKNLSVKELVEHGPLSVAANVGGASWSTCKTEKKDYKGLDEFRSQYSSSYDSIKAKVEKTVEINKRKVTIIDTGNCGTCENNCQTCDSTKLSKTDYGKCVATKDKCEKDLSDCKDKLKKCQDASPWYSLRLIDQLIYLKGKTKELEKKVQADEDELSKATSTLSSCYLAVSYVDLYKINQAVNLNNQVVMTAPEKFNDTETNKPVSIAKYCQGFNYSNSSCLNRCNDFCPDNSQKAITEYQKCDKKCKTCKPDDSSCLKDQESCQKEQEDCVEKAYNKRPCPNAPDPSTTKTFQDCIDTCKSDCNDVCTTKYLPCSDEFAFCKSRCDDNSQCVLNNEKSCLFGTSAKGFIDCSTRNVDSNNRDYCFNNAYMCQNGSDEYAGYPDCLNKTISDYSPGASSDKYSSSFFYNNPDSQKCKNPYDKPEDNSVCINKKSSSLADSAIAIGIGTLLGGPVGGLIAGGVAMGTSSDENSGMPVISCQNVCPETTKCPSASSCPDCQCDKIDQSIKFAVPNENNKKNVGNEGFTTSEQKISAYRMTGPQCNSYSYNDDPLTFYCEDNWWNDPNREGLLPTPLGSEMICPKSEEVPVGQTVDDAKGWANDLIKKTDKINESTQKAIDQMDKIGRAFKTSPIQNYCKCDAKFQTNKPICKTGCQYNQQLVNMNTYDDDGNITGTYQQWVCSCNFVPCNGKPCEQITDYLTDLFNDIRQLKIDFVDFDTYMIKEPRSDVMKELNYSRKTTNNCSLVNNAYGSSARLLDCTRVEDEIIDPTNKDKINLDGKTVNGYCYGTKMGKLVNKSLTDNWFCCEEWSTNPTLRAGQSN